jgi:hypothetical protein
MATHLLGVSVDIGSAQGPHCAVSLHDVTVQPGVAVLLPSIRVD